MIYIKLKILKEFRLCFVRLNFYFLGEKEVKTFLMLRISMKHTIWWGTGCETPMYLGRDAKKKVVTLFVQI